MEYRWPPQYDRSYVPDREEPFWNREVETMDPQEREERTIVPKLKAQLEYAYSHSAFYRQKWESAGVRPEDIRSLEDFEKVPVVTKDEIRADQADHPPFGSNLCVSAAELGRVQGTSGTTGKPTAFGISKGDMARIAEAHARIMWSFGVRQDDTVFIGSFFSLYWGSWGALAGAERLGATAFPFGAGVAGQSDRALEWMNEVRPTVFYGTPSYSLYLAEKAYKAGLDPKKDFNFRETKKFIMDFGRKYDISLGFDVDYEVVESNLHWVLDFYEAALKRDRVLLENALKEGEERKVNRFVLITGGFHSDGLTLQMREKQVPYILVAPRILDPTAQTPYEDVMRAQADSVRGYKGIVK